MIAKYYQLLKDLIGFRTISEDQDESKELKKTAKRFKKIFEENKIECEIIEWYWNPIIYAEYENNKNLPTCLIYWNYDTINAENSKSWKNDPFSLFIWKEKIYGRWTANNKWQILVHIIAILELIKEKNIWYNIKFLIDWEKNNWSQLTIKFIESNKEKLKSDFLFISDWTQINQRPSIWISSRWKIRINLSIKSADNDIDSETYWWIVPNSIQEMNKLLSKLYWANQQINIPYFYYDVEDIPFNNILNNKKIEYDREKFKKDNWVWEIFKEKNNDFFSQIWMRPTVQITSIQWWSKDNLWIIPRNSEAEITFKIVKKQDPDKIIKSFEQRILSNLPDYMNFDIYVREKTSRNKIDINNKYYEKAKNLLENIYKKDIIEQNMWISIPILNIIQTEITDNIIVFPLANNDCNYKWVNENLNIENIEKWILFSLNFFSKQKQLF